jgi:hypothetical protein
MARMTDPAPFWTPARAGHDLLAAQELLIRGTVRVPARVYHGNLGEGDHWHDPAGFCAGSMARSIHWRAEMRHPLRGCNFILAG